MQPLQPQTGSRDDRTHRSSACSRARTAAAGGLNASSRRVEPEFALREQRADVTRYLARLGVPARMVEELAHDVLLTAHLRRDSFRGQSSTRTWLRGIALHLVLNWRRRKGNHEVCCDILSNVSEADCGWHAAPSDAFGDCAFREMCGRIESALVGQPEAARRLWKMVVLDETPVAAAARSLALNEQRAYLLLARTNKVVRDAVRKHGAACAAVRCNS